MLLQAIANHSTEERVSELRTRKNMPGLFRDEQSYDLLTVVKSLIQEMCPAQDKVSKNPTDKSLKDQ